MTPTSPPIKVAVVTGAGSGIGRSVTVALLDKGYKVVLAGRNKKTLDKTIIESGKPESHALAVPTDVTKPDDVQSLFRLAAKAFGRIDILFNNAGTFDGGGPLENIDYAVWKRVIDVNLNGAFLCAQHAFRCMKEQQPPGGRIINNGSISAQSPRHDAVPYTASKHAITGLTKSLSLAGRQWDIACGQIDIGNTSTDMTRGMSTGMLQADGSIKTEPTMEIEHAVETVLLMADLPLHANIQFVTVMATKMPFIGRG